MVVLCLIAALTAAFPIAAQAETALQTANVQVGDIIKFGRYEQDNDLSNGAEEIAWRVLAQVGARSLVISVMGLDEKPYHAEKEDVTWEGCTLREWLNNDFYTAAFNERERERIELTNVVNEDNPNYSTDGGDDTEESIFLLSIAEAERYFDSDEDRIIKPTAYAIAHGAWRSSGWWWLRSPGGTQAVAAGVFTDGRISYAGSLVNHEVRLVRPAMWINIDN